MAILQVMDTGSACWVSIAFALAYMPVRAGMRRIGTPDTVRPLGIKGIGEIGVVGVSAAIANGVYHATGRRIRSLPITIEQLL
jgi:CO/xanthine dehydrogenase Mo-binding subunit